MGSSYRRALAGAPPPRPCSPPAVRPRVRRPGHTTAPDGPRRAQPRPAAACAGWDDNASWSAPHQCYAASLIVRHERRRELRASDARKTWKAARPAGSAAAAPVGSWDAITKGVPSWMVTASSAGKPFPDGQCMPSGRGLPIVMAWSLCGTAGHGCAAAARMVVLGGQPGSASPVLRSPVPRRCRVLERGQRRLSWSPRGTVPVPLLCGLPAGPACRQGLGVAVVPGGGPWIRWLADPSALVRGTALVSGGFVGDPGRLQLDRSPGGVVHLRDRQAEPVPQAPEPFAAGPGDRLLQLPLADEVSGAGGRARHGCRARCGLAARVLVIWCRVIPGHGGLLGGLAWADATCRGWRGDDLKSGSARSGWAAWLVPLWAAAEVFTTHNRPQDSPRDGPQESGTPAFR